MSGSTYRPPELENPVAAQVRVYSATGRTELRRLHHVPLLPLLRTRINRILETTAVTQEHAAEIVEEEEEAGEESPEAERSEGAESGAIGDEKL